MVKTASRAAHISGIYMETGQYAQHSCIACRVGKRKCDRIKAACSTCSRYAPLPILITVLGGTNH